MAKRLRSCPCCGDRNIETEYEGMYDKSYLKKGKFALYICKKCSLEFVNPVLSEKELGQYYPAEEYYSFYDYNKLALTYHKLSAIYHSGNRVISLLIAPFRSLLYTYYISPGKSVLEVGCGNGMKLEIYRSYGLKTSGLEPYGPELTEKEKRLGIERKGIGDANYSEGSFDYIVLKEVLEHVPDQKKILEKCRFWLKRGGKLIITVPNTDSLWKKIYGRNWFGYDVPRHVYNYNPRNIAIMLKKAGLRITRIRPYDMPYMLDGSMKFKMVERTGKKEHPIIFSNVSKVIFAPISLAINYTKKGSLMEIECTK